MTAVLALVLTLGASVGKTGPGGIVARGEELFVWWSDGRLDVHAAGASTRQIRTELRAVKEVVSDRDGLLVIGAGASGESTALIVDAHGKVLKRWSLGGEARGAASREGRRVVITSRGVIELNDNGAAVLDPDVAEDVRPLLADASVIVCTRFDTARRSNCRRIGAKPWQQDGRWREFPILCGSLLVEREPGGILLRFADERSAGDQMNRLAIPKDAIIACGMPGQIVVVGARIEVIEPLTERRFRGNVTATPRPVAATVVAGRIAVLERDGTVRFVDHPVLAPGVESPQHGGVLGLGGGRFLLWRKGGPVQFGTAAQGWATPLWLPDPLSWFLPTGDVVVGSGCLVDAATGRETGVALRFDERGRVLTRWTWDAGCLGPVVSVDARLLTTGPASNAASGALLELRPDGGVVSGEVVERTTKLIPGLSNVEVGCEPGWMAKQSPRQANCRSRKQGWRYEGAWDGHPLGCGSYLIHMTMGGRSVEVRDAMNGARLQTRKSYGQGYRILGCDADELFVEQGGLVALKLPKLSPSWRRGRTRSRLGGVARSGDVLAVVRADGSTVFLMKPTGSGDIGTAPRAP